MLTEIALVVLLAMCNGFFALSEMALVASRKIRLKQLAKQSPGGRIALRQAEAPERFLSTVQVGITLVMLITGASAGDALAGHIASGLQQRLSLPGLAPYAHGMGYVLGFIMISFLQIVIGELVPKRLALAAPERLASVVAWPMQFLARLCTPFVWLLNACSSGLLRLLRVRGRSQEAISEEEIRLLVAEGTEQGVLDRDEQNMLNRVLRLGDRTVGSLMTPRMRIAWLDMADTQAHNLEVLRDTPYSRYPVYRHDQSEIVGVLEVKNLLRHLGGQAPADLLAQLSKPFYVPGTARALDLLEAFRDAETLLALVVDEYGEIEGIITLNDLLGAVVGVGGVLGHARHGGTQAETVEERLQGPIRPREGGGWLVDGALSCEDLRELLKLEGLPGEEEHDYHTVAGMVMSALGHLPQTGEVFVWRGVRFEVLELDGARIQQLAVIPGHEGPADDAQ